MSSNIKVLADLVLSNDISSTELPKFPSYGQLAFKQGVPYIWSKVNGEDQWLKSSGDSAYDIAVANGYKGDKVQWLKSLKGEKGDAFKIIHTYKSIEQMNQDTGNTFPDNSFVLISNGPTDPDTGKVYSWNKSSLTFSYMFSLQGQAIQGNDGASAYEIAVEHGYDGTESAWLESLSAYGLAVKQGYVGTLAEWLASLKGDTGDTGKSAYEDAVAEGFTGTKLQWLESLKGDSGKSAYQVAVDNGFEGTPAEWLASMKGEQGERGIQGLQGPKGDPFKIVRTYYRIEDMENDRENLQANVMVCVTDLDATSARIYWYDGLDFTYILNMKDTVVKGDDGKSAYELALEMNLFDGTAEEWIKSLKGEKGDTGKDLFEYWKELENKPEATEKEFVDYFRGADGGDTAIFSFTERKINKVWTTNKQMWRKVIKLNDLAEPSSSTSHRYDLTFPLNISNIEDIVTITGAAVGSNGICPITYAGYYTDTAYTNITCYIKPNKQSIIIRLKGADFAGYSGFIVLEYTKTTDTALSQAAIDALDDGRGEPGLSAYQVAVQYAEYQGTEREWIASMTKPALPDGGTTGQFLVKQSDSNAVAGWQNLKVESRTFTYEQVSASDEWTIVHNLNTTEFTTRVASLSGDEIICDLEVVNPNVVKIYLTEPMSGTFFMAAKTNESVPVQTRFVEVDQYSEKVYDVGTVHGDVNILISSGPIQYLEPDGDINLKVLDWASAGRSAGVTLDIKITDTVHNLTFADNIMWSFEMAPVLTEYSRTRFTIFSEDGGNTVCGFFVGKFKLPEPIEEEQIEEQLL